MKEKNTLVTQSCVLSDASFGDLKIYFWSLESKFVDNYFFLLNFVSSEGADSQNVYTINLSPLLVTKYGLMLITILSNYK